MVLPEIFKSLHELQSLEMDWTVAICGTGPLTRAIQGQLSGDQQPNEKLKALGRILVLDEGDDLATLRKLAGLIEGDPDQKKLPVTIVANFIDRSLMRAVERRCFEDGIQPRFVVLSAADLIAEHTIRRQRLFQTAKWRNQKKLHVAILGFDTLGRSFLDEILLNGIAEGLQMPAVNIITHDVVHSEAILRRDMPEYSKSAEIYLTPLKIEELGSPQLSPLAQAEATNPLTAIFVLLDDAKQNLRAVAEICALQDLHGLAHAAVFVGGPGAHEAVRLIAPQRGSHNLALDITEINELSALPDLLSVILVERDSVARRIHQTYEKQYSGKTKAGTSWAEIPETYRRANRRAASHLIQKLDALGLDLDFLNILAIIQIRNFDLRIKMPDARCSYKRTFLWPPSKTRR